MLIDFHTDESFVTNLLQLIIRLYNPKLFNKLESDKLRKAYRKYEHDKTAFINIAYRDVYEEIKNRVIIAFLDQMFLTWNPIERHVFFNTNNLPAELMDLQFSFIKFPKLTIRNEIINILMNQKFNNNKIPESPVTYHSDLGTDIKIYFTIDRKILKDPDKFWIQFNKCC